MSDAPAPTGTLEAAMAQALRLLEQDPALAFEQASEILVVVPGHAPARLLQAAAKRRGGDAAAALALLEPLLQERPDWLPALYERALALGAAGQGDASISALRDLLRLQPTHPEAWRTLADHLMATGETDEADAAYARHVRCASRNPPLQQAAAAMLANDMPRAERLLKDHLKQVPTDVPAIRMLAEVAVRCGENRAAGHLLDRCLQLAPGFQPARYARAVLLHRDNKAAEALAEVERLLAADPVNPSYRNLHAVLLSHVGEVDRACAIYDRLLREYPGNAKVWLSYGHVLKTAGRQDDCIAAYRASIAREPSLGEAYWSLANLKTFRFGAEDLTTMRARVADPRLGDADRLNFHFALGKAEEDAGEHAAAFEHYDSGNALQRARLPFDRALNTARMRHLKEVFTREHFERRAGLGHASRAPIFIVGMPRAGSTLIEQILASHSAVEGTSELPNIISMARELRQHADEDGRRGYAEVLAALDPADLRELGDRYLRDTRVYRKTDRPFFIDKMPNNFLHVGLIHSILPDATIIDARRHPLGCCLSNFKQLYARGQRFSYGLADMGSYYRDYVELMAHFDAVLPGRVHRVIYERMVEDTESEVRRLLDHCGLPFEPGCLRFFENDRPVRTASSEQVRRPIYREGVDQWRRFEPWLDPLKQELGPVLDAYPEVPASY
ncbi:MAG: sulfotransferase family protein [Gammaproteobacteria bacterium]|nr:sulfotransferase family protein [Gammaproteobacteria bacterium]